MNFEVNLEEAATPFYLFPVSPEQFQNDHNLDNVVSPLPSNHMSDLYSDSYDYPDSWHNLTQLSPVTGDVGFSPYSSNSVSSQDEYFLTSLDEVTSANDVITSTTSMNKNSSTMWEASSENSSSDSVTSKLKSVLMSRKRIKDGCSSSSLGCDSSISAIHNYSSGEKKRKYEHQNEANNNPYQGGNKYYPHSSLRFPPCFVCGGTASGLHYGVNSCEPCKGFFTRYLRRKEDEYYKCTKQGKCVITNKLRGNCSACRLKKCLALGMSRKNSRLGRYSLSRRMETIMQVNELENNSIEESAVRSNPLFNTAIEIESSSPTSASEDSSSAEEVTISSEARRSIGEIKTCRQKAQPGFSQKLVKVLVDYMELIQPYGEDLVTEEQIKDKLKSHYDEYQLKIELFGNLKTIPREEYFNLLKGYGIEIDKRMMFLKESANEIMDIIERYCNFAKQVPNFKSLSNRDQSNLLKSSRYDFFMILMHEGYMEEYQCFLAHNGVAFHQEEVADKFFSRQLVIAVCDTYYRLQKLQLSKAEKALLIAICLVFTDRCTLENPKLVEQIQISLTQLLRHQLEITCRSSASKRFTKIIDCLIRMRESSELYLKEYNQLCQDEMVIEEVPIMTELLFEDK